MKKLIGLVAILWMIESAAFVFADPNYGSRYNPYSPYQRSSSPDQSATKEGGRYDSDRGTDSYYTEPRRWYDSQENYQNRYEQKVETPRTLTSPYREVKPPSYGELTSPYEDVIPQRPDGSSPIQQLTPPVQK